MGARIATPYGRGCAKRSRPCRPARHRSGVGRGAAVRRRCGRAGGGRAHGGVSGRRVHRLYPAEHEGLFQRIVDEGGAVVSEHAWDEHPKPYRFRLRNRLIAGPARATPIVEAGLPSEPSPRPTRRWRRTVTCSWCPAP
ncbi:MAG: DNA-processing protein DprA [Eggerthella lenta]